jgi:hypothetical protein
LIFDNALAYIRILRKRPNSLFPQEQGRSVRKIHNIQTYYATLYQDAEISSSKALGVYSAVENAAMAAGPVVFSYIASENTALRMRTLAGDLMGGLLLFALISGARGGDKTS